LYDLIRIAPTIKESENGKELLLLVSRLVGRLILNVNHNLQSNFIGLLSLYSDENSLSFSSEIVFTILYACVQLITFNGLYFFCLIYFNFIFLQQQIPFLSLQWSTLTQEFTRSILWVY